MGKKSKKLRQPLPNEKSLENEGGEKLEKIKNKTSHNSVSNSDNNNVLSDDINSVKSSKKKKHKRALDAEISEESKFEQATGEERIKSAEDEPNPLNLEVKKKKKKKRNLPDVQEPIEATNSVTNNDCPDVPKKKKKKNKNYLLPEEQTTQEINQVHNQTEEPESQLKKKTKKPETITNGNEIQQMKTNDNVSVEIKEQKTRSQKKKRTGTAVLNDEESQVTEEDIDKFCDELDEEDNKQYDEWVKLIEANLPPPRKNN